MKIGTTILNNMTTITLRLKFEDYAHAVIDGTNLGDINAYGHITISWTEPPGDFTKLTFEGWDSSSWEFVYHLHPKVLGAYTVLIDNACETILDESLISGTWIPADCDTVNQNNDLTQCVDDFGHMVPCCYPRVPPLPTWSSIDTTLAPVVP